jgi:hypothetical protein
MTGVPFPLLSAPGRHPQASGGRLINCYPEKLSTTAAVQYAYPRVPGLINFATTSGNNFRGGIFVGSFLYVVNGASVYQIAQNGTVVQYANSVPGSGPVFLARDNAAVPDIVIVAPGVGAFVLDTVGNAVNNYPDANVNNQGTPNAVDFLKGFFFFTYGNAKTQASGVNNTSIDTTMFATAESKPDTLYRPIPLGNGQLLLCGSNSIEVWGGANTTGYPFSYISTINRGVIGPYAINGAQDGFGKGIFFVSDDLKTYTLNGYTPQLISSTDVDLAVKHETNKTAIRLGTYVASGHGFVCISGSNWTWEYEVDAGSWHERQSYQQTSWRGTQPVMAWNNAWYCGDMLSGAVLRIDGDVHDELGQPLRIRIETGPFGQFPQQVRINTIELLCTKGVGIATGIDPQQTEPAIEIQISRDGGQSWSNPRPVKIGRQALTDLRVRSSIWGQAEVQGVRWRFSEASAVPFLFMTADMLADALR